MFQIGMRRHPIKVIYLLQLKIRLKKNLLNLGTKL